VRHLHLKFDLYQLTPLPDLVLLKVRSLAGRGDVQSAYAIIRSGFCGTSAGSSSSSPPSPGSSHTLPHLLSLASPYHISSVRILPCHDLQGIRQKSDLDIVLADTLSFADYGINVCGVLAKPDVLRGIWAAPIALEVLVFVFTILNAAHRPRPANLSLGKALYRDGLLFFVALFALRVFNLVVIVSFRSSLQFVGSWCVQALQILPNSHVLPQFDLGLQFRPTSSPYSQPDAEGKDDDHSSRRRRGECCRN